MQGPLDMKELRALYSTQFIAAGPQGVMAGLQQNKGKLKVFGWVTGDQVQLLKENGLM